MKGSITSLFFGAFLAFPHSLEAMTVIPCDVEFREMVKVNYDVKDLKIGEKIELKRDNKGIYKWVLFRSYHKEGICSYDNQHSINSVKIIYLE